MTVYHGSTLEIRAPDVSHSKRFLDFGPAFYVNSFWEQAQNLARRKCARLPRSGSPVISVYELDDDLSGFAVLRFAKPNNQIALRTMRIIAAKLQFVESYSLPAEV